MLKMDYIHNLQANYQRIEVGQETQGRYQYNIIDRGGIRGLLDCSTRYVDGKTYLYYDITSKQTIHHMFQSATITRGWILDFFASFKSVLEELYRFLLDEENLLLSPQYIYQEVEQNRFYFTYLPYKEEMEEVTPDSLESLCAFLVERLDYNDSKLVESMYRIFDQISQNKMAYVKTALWKELENLETEGLAKSGRLMPEKVVEGKEDSQVDRRFVAETRDEKERPTVYRALEESREQAKKSDKRGIMNLFDLKKKKEKEEEEKQKYEEQIMRMMEASYVAEPEGYLEKEERTMLLSTPSGMGEERRFLLGENGSVLKELGKSDYLIGKAKDKADIYLTDMSVSRLHARIIWDNGEYFLEDLNSTNGTFINQEKLAVYQKKPIQVGDEIKLGGVSLSFR